MSLITAHKLRFFPRATFAAIFLLSAPYFSCFAISNSFQLSADINTLAKSDLLAFGVVDKVDSTESHMQVLAQWFSASGIKDMALLGHIVAVYGSVNTDGSYKVSSVAIIDSSYVPGATRLYVKGLVTSANLARGTVELGALSVNYSGALHTLSADELAVGKIAAFSGLSYSGVSNFFADEGSVSKVLNAGQTGSDSAGQTGSDSVGIVHTAKAGQTGSDSVGQTGSDSVGTVHTAKAGQTGSDSLGQTGSD